MTDDNNRVGQAPPRIPRRTFLKSTAAVGALALAAPWVRKVHAAETLVINFFGGEVGEIFRTTTVEPFEKKFGVSVVMDEIGSASEDYARIRASAGDPGFDVAAGLTVPEIILGANEGLLEKITVDNVPNSQYQWDKSKNSVPPYGIVQHMQYGGLYYNHDKIAKPESWLDYWSPERMYDDSLKGHLLQVEPSSILCHFALIMGAVAAGGSIKDLSPVFKLLEKQKPWIGLVESSSSKMAPYFESEEIWLSPYWSSRAAVYIERGFPMTLTVPKEGSLLLPETSAIPVGAKNKALAFEFLNFRLEKDVQRAFGLAYHTSPGRSDLGDWPESYLKGQLTSAAQIEAMTFPDYDLLAAKRPEWSLEWQRIMAT